MAHLLMIYASREGQTRKIATELAGRLGEAGHDVDLRDIEELTDPVTNERWDGIILGSSVHAGKHDRRLARWMRANRSTLRAVPSRFFSVCLAAASERPSERVAARELALRFLEEVGLPNLPFEIFAGALKYRSYGPVVRWIMRHIAARERGATDTRQDYEYTDWSAVRHFADDLERQFFGRRYC